MLQLISTFFWTFTESELKLSKFEEYLWIIPPLQTCNFEMSLMFRNWIDLFSVCSINLVFEWNVRSDVVVLEKHQILPTFSCFSFPFPYF